MRLNVRCRPCANGGKGIYEEGERACPARSLDRLTGKHYRFTYLPQNLVGTAVGANTYLKSATYDAAGRPTLFGLGVSGSNPLLQTAYTYFAWTTPNGQGRLQFLKSGTPGSPTSLQSFEYNYDVVGNLLHIYDYKAGGTQTQTFTYDAADRLKSAAASDGTGGIYSESYTYNGTTGNLASKTGLGTYTYNSTHKHAVASVTGRTFQYDANGNMTQRVISGSTYNLTYDAENRLTGVSGAATATFVYDGDGNRVKGTAGGVTTTYIGNYYEWSGSTATKYYYAGSLRLAMRQGSTLSYLFSDQLGSTSVVANSSGSKTAEVRYKAWGEDRYTSGTSPTSIRYTGQRVETSLGLYYYGARWYDPALGRFVQADTIVPNMGDPQAWDRYAYANNNPVRYNDPSGHSVPLPPTPFSNIIFPVNNGWDLAAATVCFFVCGFLPVHYESYGLGQGAIVGDKVPKAILPMVAGVPLSPEAAAFNSSAFGGAWIQRSESMSDAARAYQRFISGRSDDYVYKIGGYTFDGFDESRGILMEAKDIPANFINSATNEFKPWVSGTGNWVNQAQNQINAAGGLKIQWYFSSHAAKDAMYNLFLKTNPKLLESIELLYKPMK